MVRSLPCRAPPPSPAHTHSRKRVLALAHQRALNQPPLSSSLCPAKVLYLPSWGITLYPSLNYSVSPPLPSVLMGLCRKTPFTGWTEVCLEIFLIWGWIALISSTRSTRVAGFRTDACLGGRPSFSCPESLDKFQGFSLCLWIQIVQVQLSQEKQDSNKSVLIKISPCFCLYSPGQLNHLVSLSCRSFPSL